MAKTGVARKTRQPFHIDRLPPYVREAIDLLRNTYGKTWEEIEALSAEPFNAKLVPLGCFVDWEKLEPEVRALFPKNRIPKSNLQRYHDVRVAQVRSDVMHRSKQAREIAAVFAKSVDADGDEAVLNASRDTILGMLATDATDTGRKVATKLLLKLAEVQLKVKTNKIRERKVSVDEKALQAKLDEIDRKARALVKDATDTTGGVPVLTREEVLARVKEIYGA